MQLSRLCTSELKHFLSNLLKAIQTFKEFEFPVKLKPNKNFAKNILCMKDI